MAPVNKKEEQKFGFPLGVQNYKLLLVGFVIIVIGFSLMAHSPSDDMTKFDDSIYSFRCITLAPIVVLIGFLFEIYAIMKRTPKGDEDKK